MRIIRQSNLTALATLTASLLIIPAANACGVPSNWNGISAKPLSPLRIDARNAMESATWEEVVRDSKASVNTTASIVGMYSIQFLSMGNTKHSPSIPDGAVLDFGYVQWHSDGLEFFNSGGRAPATGNVCMGVWTQTGTSTYMLNHFALSYDGTTGALNGRTLIVQHVTVSPGGTRYSGTVTLTIFDPQGNQVDQLTGQVVATRLTADTPTP